MVCLVLKLQIVLRSVLQYDQELYKLGTQVEAGVHNNGHIVIGSAGLPHIASSSKRHFSDLSTNAY
jgi:hypothetical protein